MPISERSVTQLGVIKEMKTNEQCKQWVKYKAFKSITYKNNKTGIK